MGQFLKSIDEQAQNLPPVSWEPDGGKRIAFPCEAIQEDYENRLIGHERYKVDGARQEDTGGKATTWALTVHHYNSELHEPGVEGLTQYPETVDALTAACKTHKTGWLTLTSVGARRCKAQGYSRAESRGNGTSAGMLTAACVYRFVEDNEDDIKKAAAAWPAFASALPIIVRDATDACAFAGLDGPDLVSLSELAAQLADYAAAPGDYAAQLEARGAQIASLAEKVERSFSVAANGVRSDLGGLLANPAQSRAGKLLYRLADAAARASGVKVAARLVSRTFPDECSILEVSIAVGQPVAELIDLNPQLPDLLAIQPGTPVKCRARAA